MRCARSLLVGSALALASIGFASPLMAAPIVIKNTTVIGNNTVITRTGGTTTVSTSQSCGTGVSGSFFQTVMILFGGSAVNVTQVATCH